MEIHFEYLDKARLLLGRFIHGRRVMRAMTGAWNFYVPAMNLKLAYPAANGMIHCLHRIAPRRDLLMSGKLDDQQIGRYSADDWKRAFTTSTRHRAVENYIAASRLHAAGLGPKPLGICYVRHFSHGLSGRPGETAGILIEDINKLPAKRDATEEEIIAAGVTPDRIKSCVRQQIRGYVSDLNSVVGVIPTGAGDEIRSLLDWFDSQLNL
jgi:hypothetical protein